jgi:integrase
MSIYKRGTTYWYKFMWNGELIRESTRQKNQKVAIQQEGAHRVKLSNGELGIRTRRAVAPSLTEFALKRVAPWAEASKSHGGWLWYRAGIRALLAHKPIAVLALNEISSEKAASFAAQEQGRGLSIGSINSELRVLRRILRLAMEWGELERLPKITLIKGERQREHVITWEEEARYLSAAREPLTSIATVLLDTGLRPDECHRLAWDDITWSNGRQGTLLVRHGKTKAARRVLPLSLRVRALLEARWEAMGRPGEGWIWPARTASTHVERTSLRRHHIEALTLSGVRPFVLYSLRHTFLTRLGASGCNVWLLARIAGHSSIAISSRYVHPGETEVLEAIENLAMESGGHKIGHSSVKMLE